MQSAAGRFRLAVAWGAFADLQAMGSPWPLPESTASRQRLSFIRAAPTKRLERSYFLLQSYGASNGGRRAKQGRLSWHRMKLSITIRIDPEMLANARKCAKQENRTLTNFVETVL
jgi:hypothetical protein